MKAELTLDGSRKAIKILDFDYGFTQYIDETGKPSGFPTGGTINFVLEPKEGDTQIIDWMISPKGTKNGKIQLFLKKTREIKFKNAICIQYHESFSHVGDEQPTSVSITISAESITVDGIQFETKRKA